MMTDRSLRGALRREIVYTLQCSRIGAQWSDGQVADAVLTGLDDKRKGWDIAHPAEPAPTYNDEGALHPDAPVSTGGHFSKIREEEPDGPAIITITPCGHRVGKIVHVRPAP